MAASPERRERREPLEEEREKARSGATERVHTDGAARGGEKDAIPNHPSLGAPPRRDKSRPVFRDSQLEEGDDYQERPLRG